MAYSINFRQKVMEIKERDNLSFEKTAVRCGDSESSASRRSKRSEPDRTRNRPATKTDIARPVRDTELDPATMDERAERFGCGRRGICEALKISRKKNVLSSKN